MFTPSIKGEIEKFHFAVVQRRQRKAQKSMIRVQSCCFADLNLLLFCRSHSRRRRLCLLKLPTSSHEPSLGPFTLFSMCVIYSRSQSFRFLSTGVSLQDASRQEALGGDCKQLWAIDTHRRLVSSVGSAAVWSDKDEKPWITSHSTFTYLVLVGRKRTYTTSRKE